MSETGPPGTSGQPVHAMSEPVDRTQQKQRESEVYEKIKQTNKKKNAASYVEMVT